MGLDNPEIKMSKSISSPNHAIFLLDSDSEIDKKIKKAVTDSKSEIVFDESRAGLYNLLGIYEILSKKARDEIENEFSNKGYGDFKKSLSELVISHIAPIREKYMRLSNDKAYVQSILKEGAEQVRPIARETYFRAKERVGLL